MHWAEKSSADLISFTPSLPPFGWLRSRDWGRQRGSGETREKPVLTVRKRNLGIRWISVPIVAQLFSNHDLGQPWPWGSLSLSCLIGKMELTPRLTGRTSDILSTDLAHRMESIPPTPSYHCHLSLSISRTRTVPSASDLQMRLLFGSLQQTTL